ncbi:MAG TPA: zf-HC2 domain-containing protein [Pyrinomonadaceae bacterium]|nr:zf-HC2 domain-containing protein [Pyrinomonadaceae bacterium]
MKCAECQALVQEYFDGELDQRAAAAMSVHLESCPSCSTELEQLAFEQRVYQSYEHELEVSPALWVKVRDRLAEEDNGWTLTLFGRSQIAFSKLLSLRFGTAAAVAVALFAIVVILGVMKQQNKQEVPKQLALSSETLPGEKRRPGETDIVSKQVNSNGAEGSIRGPQKKRGVVAGLRAETVRGKSSLVNGNAREPKTPVQFVRKAEQQYLSAIALLTRDAEQRPSRLDSETRAKLNSALVAVNRTILSTRKAVQRNPNDPLAVQYMLSAYEKKVDVLKEMSSY